MNVWICLYRAAQWLWGLPQNAAGLLVWLLWGEKPCQPFFGALLIRHHCPFVPADGCFSLGMFLFMGHRLGKEEEKRLAVHEFGHSVQSLITGPLYLPIIFLPSLLAFYYYRRHRHRVHKRYCDHWPENTANFWGKTVTGGEGVNW